MAFDKRDSRLDPNGSRWILSFVERNSLRNDSIFTVVFLRAGNADTRAENYRYYPR